MILWWKRTRTKSNRRAKVENAFIRAKHTNRKHRGCQWTSDWKRLHFNFVTWVSNFTIDHFTLIVPKSNTKWFVWIQSMIYFLFFHHLIFISIAFARTRLEIFETMVQTIIRHKMKSNCTNEYAINKTNRRVHIAIMYTHCRQQQKFEFVNLPWAIHQFSFTFSLGDFLLSNYIVWSMLCVRLLCGFVICSSSTRRRVSAFSSMCVHKYR